MSKPEVFICSAVRTPIGSFQGALSDVVAPRLGATVIKAALERAKVSPELVGEVYMGNVLSAGQGQAPARQAAIYAGVPVRVPCTTVAKVCGSGMMSVILGVKAIQLGDAEIVVAGGMESMSNVPYYLPTARKGMRMGNSTVVDGMVHDGLWDPYKNFHMGNAGELCAREMSFTREAQDQFSKESYRRAPEDEEPKKGDPEKMSTLKPAFDKAGTITAANASKINDGASALVLASEAAVKTHGLTPLARIAAYGGAAQEPEWFTTAPSAAIANTLPRAGLSVGDIGLWEVNEAFAVVALAVAQKSGIDLAKLNVHGGAVALGHPIGSSGSRIVTTLVHAMAQRGEKRGCASICIGGGEGLALVVER